MIRSMGALADTGLSGADDVTGDGRPVSLWVSGCRPLLVRGEVTEDRGSWERGGAAGRVLLGVVLKEAEGLNGKDKRQACGWVQWGRTV